MAPQIIPTSLLLSVILLLLLPFSHGDAVICEKLPENVCSLSVSWTGKRCVLEKSKWEYYCKTSEVEVQSHSDWIETDECVKACGVDRMTIGISSDSLLDSQFIAKLCSPMCYESCHNVVDLYFNLAAAEGAFLPDLCKAQRANPHRSMVELVSSGLVGPVSEDFITPSPAPSA